MHQYLILLILSIVPVKTGLTQSLQTLSLNEVKPEGWIREQIVTDWSTGNFSMLPNNSFLPTTLGAVLKNSSPKILDEYSRSVYLWNFGEMEGNLADAVIRAAFLAENENLKDYSKIIMDFMSDKIAATQYVDSVAFNHDNGGELFGITCMGRAMLAYHEYSGDPKYLDAIKSLTDKIIIQWNHNFDEGKTYFGRDFEKKGAMFHSLAFCDILEYLYRKTDELKYVNFAFRLYNDFNINADNMASHGTDAVLENLTNKSLMFYGHGPHTAEQLRTPAWLSTFTYDSSALFRSKYENALENIQQKLNKSLSPSLGLVTDPGKHESVNGKSSSGNLPYEYCSLTETFHTFTYLSREFGLTNLADQAEILFFNSAQGARFNDGNANAYLSCDNIAIATEVRNWRDQYSALHGIRCCNLNAARIAPSYVANMWLKKTGTNELIAQLHGPSKIETEINGTRVIIFADTNYPFEDTIRYTIIPESPLKFTLKIRNPGWSPDTEIIGIGNIETGNGLIKIENTFSAFDEIKVVFKREIELKQLDNPDSKDFYVQRGPLVYAFPYENQKTPFQARQGFPNYFHWDIEIPDSLKLDFVSMKMLRNSLELYEKDSSFLRFQTSPDHQTQKPFDFPDGFITGRFISKGKLVERDLLPMGCLITRRTTFTPSEQLNALTPVTIELEGKRSLSPGEYSSFHAIVRDQNNTVIEDTQLTWKASEGVINLDGTYTAPYSVNEVIISVSCGSITSNFQVRVNHDLSDSSVKNPEQFVYPTITTGIIHFSKAARNIAIYNLYGQTVYWKYSILTKNIDISNLETGFYILKLDGKATKIYKL